MSSNKDKYKNLPIVRDVAWRHSEILLRNTNITSADPVVIRVCQAVDTGFYNDPEVYIIFQIKERGREHVESLALGGAPISVISEVTETPPEIIELYLAVFFDVLDIKSPLVRAQIAHKELNPGLRSLKVYSAKKGWKAYIDMHMPEIKLDDLNPEEEYKRIYLNAKMKFEESAILPTGSPASRECMGWGRLAGELLSGLKRTQEASGKDVDEDVKAMVEKVGKDAAVTKTADDLEFFDFSEDEETKK